jgi:hypothetical protein
MLIRAIRDVAAGRVILGGVYAIIGTTLLALAVKFWR